MHPGNEVVALEAQSLPVEPVPEREGRQSSAELQPGEVVVLCIDGVIEAWSGRREAFGTERLRAVPADIAAPTSAGDAVEATRAPVGDLAVVAHQVTAGINRALSPEGAER